MMVNSNLRLLIRELLPALLIVLVQAFACIFFVIDALSEEERSGPQVGNDWLEVGVAFALVAGTVVGAVYILRLVREIRQRKHVVAIARGALARIMADRFAEWRLSSAEADVALFALKGMTIAEVADLRGAARGTVRAQLSQVYAKAGVTSQAMLMSLFLDELMADEGLSKARV